MKQPLNDPASASATYANGVAVPMTPMLDGTARADIVIIGAGITGLSAALHLARDGRDVAVLDAGTIARGGSGRALGLVLPHHKLGAEQLLARFGHAAGTRMVAGILDGPRLVRELVDTYAIECQLTHGGWIMAAHTPDAEAGIRASVAAWRKDTDQVDLLSSGQMEAAIGSSYYRCGLIDRRALGLNPYAYTVGLARAALAHGARIYTNSRAVSLKRDARRWQATTIAGQIEAPQVLVATDAYADELLPSLRRALLPVRAYQLVSESLSPALGATILPQRAILTDSRRLFGGVRKTDDGRLQISVDGPPTAFSGRAFRAAGTERIRALFPQIDDLRWADEWSGWVGMTRSHLPHVWQIDDGLTAAVGMNGRGIAMATLLGRDISLHLTGAAEEDCFMPTSRPAPWIGHGVLHPAVETVVRWYRLRDHLDLKRPRNT